MRLFAILPHLRRESTQLKRIRDATMLHSDFLLTHITCGFGSVLIEQLARLPVTESPRTKL
jgi:capsular polysaccharide biosynthesis protein